MKYVLFIFALIGFNAINFVISEYVLLLGHRCDNIKNPDNIPAFKATMYYLFYKAVPILYFIFQVWSWPTGLLFLWNKKINKELDLLKKYPED